MNLDDTTEGLRDRLATIDRLKPHSEIPNQITAPAAIISLGPGAISDLDETLTVQFKVLVLVSLASAKDAQKRLRSYCDITGDNSIRAAIEGDQTLGGNVDYTAWLGWNEPASYEVGGTEYLGVEFAVEVSG